MNENVPEPIPPPVPPAFKQDRRYLRIILKAAGIGIGLGIGIALVAAFLIWYSSRPKPPKPWNTTALTAEYDDMESGTDPEKPGEHPVFCYVIQNNTPLDYDLTDISATHLDVVLKRENGIAEHKDFLKGEYPAFIPAKGRGRFCIRLEYSTTIDVVHDATDEQRKTYHKALEKLARDQFSNLNGFALFDEGMRYEIMFPPGWLMEK